jgi:hypothetical protein
VTSPSRSGTAGRGASATGLWAAFAALGLLVLALDVTPITNNDIFLHLRTGALVLETGRVPHADDYSALARGRPFVAHEWLAGVVFRLAQVAGGGTGFDALILFKCLVALVLCGVLYRAAIDSGAAPAVSLACLAFVMILAAARFLERPHILAWLLLGLFLASLARRRSRRAAGGPGGGLLILIPLQVLWANIHGSFLLGPGVVVLAAAAEAMEGLGLVPWPGAEAAAAGAERRREAMRLMALAAGLGLASLLNPYGVALLRFPFELTGSVFMDLIYEWQPPYSSQFRTTYMAIYYAVWAVAGFAVMAAALRRSRRTGAPPAGLFPFLVFAAFFALSLRMNRNVTDFALATVPGVAGLFTWILPGRPDRPGPEEGRLSRRAGAWVAAILLGLAAWFAVAGYAYSPSGARRPGLGLGRSIPVAAADYVARNGIRGNCFNTYSAGAYLAYRFYPAVRVGMDSRNDVYGEALYADYAIALSSADGLARMLARLDATFVFLEWPQSHLATTAAALGAIPGGWRPVYFDDVAVVYLGEQGPYAGLAARDGFRLLDPSLFRPGSWSEAQAAAVLPEADRAIAASGGSCIARVMRIEALSVLGRSDEARKEEALLVAEDPPLAHIHALLGLGHLARGERSEAAARFRRALAFNPYMDAARTGLAQADAGR